jgi:hypothetical protein
MTLIGVGKPSSGSGERVPSRPDPARTRLAWTLLGVLGAVFVLVGLADILLAVYPPSRNPTWQFGVISSILNGLAIPTMGGYLMLSALLARGKVTETRVISSLALAGAVLLVILALVYLRAIPLAVRSLAANDAPALGTKKTVAKAGFLFVVYIALFVFAGVQGLRASHKR